MDEQRKWFLEMGSAPGEDAVKTVKITTKDLLLKYYTHLIYKAEAGFERFDSNYEKKFYYEQNAIKQHHLLL